MAVFPASILHEVALNRAQTDLILVSARFRFADQNVAGGGTPLVNPAIRVSSVFAVPFGEGRLPQQRMFERRFNLFLWPESCVQELRVFMLNCVAQTVLQVSDLDPTEAAGLRLQDHTWFHITRYAGSFVAHNHALASWSRCTCVRAGERTADHPGSGVLRFVDPRQGAGAYLNLANRCLRPGFALKPREVLLEVGQVIVFP